MAVTAITLNGILSVSTSMRGHLIHKTFITRIYIHTHTQTVAARRRGPRKSQSLSGAGVQEQGVDDKGKNDS